MIIQFNWLAPPVFYSLGGDVNGGEFVTSQYHLMHRQQIVKITHKGVVDSDEMNLGKEAAFQSLSLNGWYRILLDLEDADLQFDATDVGSLFKNIGETFPDDVFLAVVRPRQVGFDFCQYAKTVAPAWCNVTIQVFSQEDLATRWLAEQ